MLEFQETKHMFESVQISTELMRIVSEDVRKFVPGFVHLLNCAWDGRSSIDEAAKSMLSKDNKKLLSSLSNGQIIQVETFNFFCRIRRFRASATIGLASIDRYIQISIYLFGFNSKDKRYHTRCSSEAQNPVEQSGTIPAMRASSPYVEKFNTEKHRLMKLLEIMGKRLYVLELQQAFYGMSTPPHIVIEIEDLRQKVIKLRFKLAQEPIDEQMGWFTVKGDMQLSRDIGTA